MKILIVFVIIIAVAMTINTLYMQRAKKRAAAKREKEINALGLKRTTILRYMSIIAHVDKYNWDDLIKCHKALQAEGILPKNCDVCSWGIVRADSIADINKDNIYLGGIHGLWTKSIADWEKFNDDQSKNIVWNQYKSFLYDNLKFEVAKITSEIMNLNM